MRSDIILFMTTPSPNPLIDHLRPYISRERLVETAIALIDVPSKTGEAGAVSDRLASILSKDGFKVERPTGGYDKAPAVAVRLETEALKIQPGDWFMMKQLKRFQARDPATEN